MKQKLFIFFLGIGIPACLVGKSLEVMREGYGEDAIVSGKKKRFFS